MDGLTQSITEFFTTFLPKEIVVLVISMLPFVELRGGLVAASLLNIPLLEGFILAFLGNMIPIPFILLFIRKILKWLKNTKLVKLVHKIEEKAKSKMGQINKYKIFGLFIFVAIPIPGTGAWMGSLCAAMMDMSLKRSLPIIATGVIVAGIIMSILSYGVLPAVIN